MQKKQGNVSTKQQFCICKGPDDGIRSMIQCDKCENWFHFDCVGIDPSNVPAEYICILCKKHKPIPSKSKIKKERSSKVLIESNPLPQEHPKHIAPIDLLLSAAEKVRTAHSDFGKGRTDYKKLITNHRELVQSSSAKPDLIKKAVLKENYVYLSGEKDTDNIDENMIKLGYKSRGLIQALHSEFNIKESK